MPIPLILLGALLLLFILILALRVRLTVTSRESDCVEAKILVLTFRLYPRKKRIKLRKYSKKQLTKAERKAAKKQTKKELKKKKRASQHKKKRTLAENIRLVRAISVSLIRRTHKHLRLHAVKLHVAVATGDAATTAVLYGAVSQSISYLLAALDRVTRLKATQPAVCVEPDFTAERSRADVKIVFSLRVFGALATLFGVAFALLRNKITQKSKKPTPSDKKGR